MATLSDLLKVGAGLPAGILPSTLAPLPAINELFAQSARLAGMLEPLASYNTAIQFTLGETMTKLATSLNAAHSIKLPSFVEELSWFPHSFANGRMAALDRALQSISGGTDWARLGSRLFGNAAQSLNMDVAAKFAAHTTLSPVVENMLAAVKSATFPSSRFFGENVPRFEKLFDGIPCPRVTFNGDAMRAFVERNERFMRLADQLSLAPPCSDNSDSDDTFNESRDDSSVPNVSLQAFSASLLEALQLDPHHLHRLSPRQFELFVADRFEKMGYEAVLTGDINRRDGGIDFIARPRVNRDFGCLIAVQCEHHCGDRKTDRSKVSDLLRWRGNHFQLGVLVTNTTFTRDARFEARQPNNRAFLRLRDFDDLARWIQNNYVASCRWDEMPETIELAPGIILPLPPVVGSSSDKRLV